mgnify:CR=1 FL=1
MKTLLDLRVWKLAGMIFALASSFASTVMAARQIIDVIILPTRENIVPGITLAYRWESLPFLYTELSLLILGEIIVWLFLAPRVYRMLPRR